MLNTLFPPNIVGGAEKSVSLLAAAHVQNGHSVSVISLHDSTQVKVEDWKGVRAYYVPLQNIYWPFQTTKKPFILMRLWWHIKDMWNHKAAKIVGQILDTEKPDVLHTNNLTGFSVAVWWEAKKRNIRVVHSLRDYSLLCTRGTLFNNGRFCEKRCASCTVLAGPKSLATRWVSEVIGNSRFTLNEHIKRGYFKASQQNVIFNIADVIPVAARPIVKNAQGEIVFGFLGRVEDEKGIQVLLKACRQLPKTGWRLRIAGSGRDAVVANLQKQYQDLPIEWLGFVDADALFSTIHVLVVPSIWPEPLSRTVIESAARG
ncbi:MAG: glycosyltransferase family 4 protein, partial [Alphaproteobacteria bacterium]|nr:glycosyltransferase family 4 protein [Alphaproteobacteria bacterium]